MTRTTRLTIPAILLFLAGPAFAATYSLDVAPNRKDATYKVGEEIQFRVTLRTDDRAAGTTPIAYTVTKGDGTQLDAGSITLNKSPVIKVKLDQPGFVRCEIKLQAGNLTINEAAGAAVAPDQLKPSLPPPDDFDAFWQSQRKLLDAAPAEPKLSPAEAKDAATVVLSDVEVATLGDFAPLRGYIARPKTAKPKSLPAILYPQTDDAIRFSARDTNAGMTSPAVAGSRVGQAVIGAKAGMLALDFNLHGVANGQTMQNYLDLSTGEYKDSLACNMADRDAAYLRGCVLRLMRAIDLLAQQPEWDGRTIIVRGTGIGGGQALIAAGLDDRVTLCLAMRPAFCELSGAASGWPRVVNAGDAKAAETARYFDTVNFARRIKSPTYVNVSHGDPLFPPAGVYAAYNSIPAGVDKHILTAASSKELTAQLDGIMRKHIASNRTRAGAATQP